MVVFCPRSLYYVGICLKSQKISTGFGKNPLLSPALPASTSCRTKTDRDRKSVV